MINKINNPDLEIIDIKAREILDSRGNPTIETTVFTKIASGKAAVPSGASTGIHEALELRDNDPDRYNGKGVKKAIFHVETIIKKHLLGENASDQSHIDQIMIDLDGTPNKSKLGANAILSVSMAVARAAAATLKLPLYKYLNKNATLLPVPQMNVLNGGVHADTGLSVQEIMLAPVDFPDFKSALQAGVEIFHTLGKSLKQSGKPTTVGDEGGYAPPFDSLEQALDTILSAIKTAGYTPGKDVYVAMDPAASEFYDAKSETYTLKSKGKSVAYNSEELNSFWQKICKNYPIISLEDGLAEDDWSAWKSHTKQLGDKVQIVGDDLFVTDYNRLEKGIDNQVANSILIKLNQIGTLTETIQTIVLAHESNYTTVISHRSGETTDDFIADLAVAMGTGQIKTGSLSRGERIAKYNRLLEIESELGKKAIFAGFGAFNSFNF